MTDRGWAAATPLSQQDPTEGTGGLLRPRTVDVGGRKLKVVSHMYTGGSGEVYRVESSDHSPFALKLFVPRYDLKPLFLGRASDPEWLQLSTAVKFARAEHEFLFNIRHPNIVRVYAVGDVTLQKAELAKLVEAQGHLENNALPAIVTEFVEGVPLDTAIEAYHLDADDVAGLLAEVARALDYIHQIRRYMHSDVAASNILVRAESRTAVLLDFAFAKNFNFDEVKPNDRTLLFITPQRVPDVPIVKSLLQRNASNAATREQILEATFPTLDLYQFGLTMAELRPLLATRFDRRELAYYDEVTADLTTWRRAEQRKEEPLEPRLRRLGPRHFYPFGVEELAQPSPSDRTIVLPVGDEVPLVGLADSIVSNRSFRRLTTINQLSLVNFVYPGADHKRFLHVLFTYDLARRLVRQLLGTAQFRSLFDPDAVRQLLAIALLHDVNHFPFLHIVQETRIPYLTNEEVLKVFCDGRTTGELASKEPSIFELLKALGISPQRFHSLAYQKGHDQADDRDQVINSIVNSGADIDKISYLTLDSLFTGVRYGQGIDVNTLIQAATIARTPLGRWHLAYDERALQAVENVFMTRFWHFRSIYWHHTNRALMAMVLQVVRRIYEEKGQHIGEYLAATKYLGDAGTLAWLDGQYESHLGEPSILRGLMESRKGIYRRLYTVRPEHPGDDDDLLFSAISSLIGQGSSYQVEVSLRQAIAQRLAEGYGIPVDVVDVLVDIPRRDMNSPGEAYIVSTTGVKPLEDISDPIKWLKSNYDQLTKRVRFFVSPRVSIAIEGHRESGRKAIQQILKQSAKEAGTPPQRGVS